VWSGPPRRLRDVRPEVDPSLAAAVDKALERSPSDRYSSAAALAEALRASPDVGHPTVAMAPPTQVLDAPDEPPCSATRVAGPRRAATADPRLSAERFDGGRPPAAVAPTVQSMSTAELATPEVVATAPDPWGSSGGDRPPSPPTHRPRLVLGGVVAAVALVVLIAVVVALGRSDTPTPAPSDAPTASSLPAPLDEALDQLEEAVRR
jgi:hypothetical protein